MFDVNMEWKQDCVVITQHGKDRVQRISGLLIHFSFLQYGHAIPSGDQHKIRVIIWKMTIDVNYYIKEEYESFINAL